MASEEPLFDPSLKKRKKKTVAFTEDPLGPDADPTAPAPDSIDNTTVDGDTVDLGPKTTHELIKSSTEEAPAKSQDDDFKAMFGDMKKKKKKKEIPLDLVGVIVLSSCPLSISSQGDDSGTSTPAAEGSAPAITPDDLDFSDIKKKKKSNKKKAAFDLDAFEKELNESKAKSGTEGADDDEDGELNNNLEHLDDADLGDDVFAQGDVPVSVEAGNEAWLKSDRDYTYPEVSI